MSFVSIGVSLFIIILFWYYLRHRYPQTDLRDLVFLLLAFVVLTLFSSFTGFVGPWTSGNLSWRGFFLEGVLAFVLCVAYLIYLRKRKK